MHDSPLLGRGARQDGQRSPAEITREFKAAKKAYDEATFKVQLLSSLLELLENDLRVVPRFAIFFFFFFYEGGNDGNAIGRARRIV